ncbi:hypothetical protein [Bacillus cereus group sp. BfR-BA-01380]|uniref:hypothetical protein n=1 Tax=Bacillus cereus group sp. BfR-BA-01380 TaxID=2920324 RepID=UPI001F5AC536|nr:hypothetical protein [Bacillus cereus group sp. BfR-BA-01380]
MEEIIVTYVTQSNEEMDIAIPNDVKTVQIIEAILHYEKIDVNHSELYELRITSDKEEWISIQHNETLRDNNIWDGFYITLHKKGALIPSFEMIPQEESKPQPKVETQPVANEETGYAWNLIE